MTRETIVKMKMDSKGNYVINIMPSQNTVHQHFFSPVTSTDLNETSSSISPLFLADDRLLPAPPRFEEEEEDLSRFFGPEGPPPLLPLLFSEQEDW